MSGQPQFRGYRRGFRPQQPAPKAPTEPKAKAVTLGNPELWTPLQIVKDPNTGWTKTTRAMNAPGGVLVNTCTRGPGFATEALVFVPHVQVQRRRDAKTGDLVAGV